MSGTRCADNFFHLIRGSDDDAVLHTAVYADEINRADTRARSRGKLVARALLLLLVSQPSVRNGRFSNVRFPFNLINVYDTRVVDYTRYSANG